MIVVLRHSMPTALNCPLHLTVLGTATTVLVAKDLTMETLSGSNSASIGQSLSPHIVLIKYTVFVRLFLLPSAPCVLGGVVQKPTSFTGRVS